MWLIYFAGSSRLSLACQHFVHASSCGIETHAHPPLAAAACLRGGYAVAYRLVGPQMEADDTLREAFTLIPISHRLGGAGKVAGSPASGGGSQPDVDEAQHPAPSEPFAQCNKRCLMGLVDALSLKVSL